MLKKRTTWKTKLVLVLALITITGIAIIAMYWKNPQQPASSIVVEHWTEMVEPDRQVTLNQLADDFMTLNPSITVIIVPVAEDEISQKLEEAKASHTLPDTIRVSFEYVSGWTLDGILDPTPATEIIEELGEDTWGIGTLALFKSISGEGYAAVPTDGWLQGIWYRKDLFEAAGLQPPTSWETILEASKTLNNPSEDFYGIVVGTDPEAVFTQQNYEHFALSYDVKAFDYYTRSPTLDTREQAAVLDFYTKLANFTPPQPNTWSEANEYYLTGKTAMMMYSTYIIDDILGIDKRDWTPIPSLPKLTGFISTIEGPTGKKSAWGNLNGFGITTTADKEAAKAWIKYILDERLYDYISMSIVGMMPARNTVVERWKEHKYFQEYAPGLADQIFIGFNYIERWGHQQGKVFPEISVLYSELFIPSAIGEILKGTMNPTEAARWIQEQMETSR